MDYSIAKIKDKINFYKKTGKVVSSFFLTPSEVYNLIYVLKDIPYTITGGYEEAERKIIIIGDENEKIDTFCDLLRITSKNKELTHREVLGSILGLGIKREIIGDLIVNKNICDIIVMHEMKEFILNNLNYCGREKVQVESISFNNIQQAYAVREVKNITVASFRIDAVLSAVYGISREKSSTLISLEKVLINYIPCLNISKAVKKDDLISVRGFGRVKILDMLGETKKGRQRICVEIY